MYADHETGSMHRAISETNRRRKIQQKYNQQHGIEPVGIQKAIEAGLRELIPKEEKPKLDLNKIPKSEFRQLLRELNAQMDLAAKNLQFEKAAELRDQIGDIKAKL